MMEIEAAAAACHSFQAHAPAAPDAAPEPGLDLPVQPKTVRETGLDQQLIVELTAKALFMGGRSHLPVLTAKLRLSINVLREVLDFMVAEQLAEVAWRGESDIDVQYQLTGAGKLRGAEYLARCRYVGPAPVTLEAYRAVVERQSARRLPAAARVTADELAAAFADDGLEPAVRELIGAAVHARRSLLLHGPSGSGKSTLAGRLGRLQQGQVAIPYAILVEHQIVQLHDPALHLAPSAPQQRQPHERRSSDTRWTVCQRPVVRVGAELCADMLDLRHDPASGLYQAPPHLKANNGILIVDDLGRQRVATADLLNRWSGPLDAGHDQLALLGGHKVTVPFDLMLVLATNLPPHGLLDDASMRRIGYKIHIGALSESSYRKLFRHQCRDARIVYDEAAMRYLIDRLHAPARRPLLASYPRELLGRIGDFASFAGCAPRLTVATLDQAWTSMFAACEAAPAPSPAASFDAVGASCLFEKIG